MADFTKYRIDEVCEFTNGFAFKSGDYIERSKETLEVFRMGYIERGGGFKEDSTPVFVPKNYGRDLSKYLLRKDDVLIAMTDMKNNVAILANTARVKDEGRFVLNQRVGCLRVIDKNLLDPTFFYFYSNFKPHVEYLRSRANSGVQVNLSTSSIKEAEILVPPLTEQKAIASVLGALDDKIENNRRMNETLEEIARAIFKSWFVDFDPVHAKAAGNAPAHMNAETAALFPNSFGNDGLPNGWRFSTIEANGVVITGKTPSTKRPEYYGNEYPFIKIPNMASVWVTETETALSEAGHLTQSNKLLPKGTVIVSCIASPGEVSIVSKPSHTNQQVNAVVPNEDCPTSWLYCALANLRPEIIGMASGGSVTPNLNKGDFSHIKVIHPSNALMCSFDKNVRSLFDKILSNEDENQILTELRDTLLPKLMSGEIRVKDAEREVEAAV